MLTEYVCGILRSLIGMKDQMIWSIPFFISRIKKSYHEFGTGFFRDIAGYHHTSI